MLTFKNWFLMESEHRFSCVLANLPIEISKKIMSWGDNHIKDKDIYEAEGREDKPHITVLYGLHTEEIQDIKDMIKGFGPLTAKLGNITKFTTNPDFDVMKIDI